MYHLENLKYLYQDLEPYINTHTLGLHYNKHAKKYLDNLNSLLLEHDFDFSITIEQLAQKINFFSWSNKEDVMFNLGGVINHNLYFKCLNKNKVEITGLLQRDLIKKYGSINEFIKAFIRESLKLKGSGYTFLEINKSGLTIKNYHNQDNPLFHKSIPLFTVDLWEHAYYLNYYNDKKKYLENVFEIADFSAANYTYNNLARNFI